MAAGEMRNEESRPAYPGPHPREWPFTGTIQRDRHGHAIPPQPAFPKVLLSIAQAAVQDRQRRQEIEALQAIARDAGTERPGGRAGLRDARPAARAGVEALIPLAHVEPMLLCYRAAMPRKRISGIEFTDGEAPGVWLKPAPGPMFRPDDLTSEDTG